MGFIGTGQSDVVVYLTPLGAEYLAGRKKSATDLAIKYFTMGDSDSNYLVKKRLQSSYVPDLTGEDSFCLKIAYDTFKYFIYNDDKQQGPVIINAYYNVEKSVTVTRNNCSPGATPTSVVYKVPAHKYSSTISQQDADQKALDDIAANSQNFANQNGVCNGEIFYNIEVSETFQRSNCGVGYIGDTGLFKIEAGTFTSTISQEDADQKALNALNIGGQAWVDNSVNGVKCNLESFLPKWEIKTEDSYCEMKFTADEVGILVVDLYGPSDGIVAGRINTPGVDITNMAYTGNNFVAPTDSPENAWMLASDMGGGSVTWRFEFNVAKLMTIYPNINSFKMEILGRNSSPMDVAGAYSIKGADQGKMIMIGSPGSYMPSNQNTNNLGLVNTNFSFQGGANGQYTSNMPVIKTFIYDKVTKTITVS